MDHLVAAWPGLGPHVTGHLVSAKAVGRLMRSLGYSRQSTVEDTEDAGPADRDAQLSPERDGRRLRRWRAAGDSVDTKAKEWLGNRDQPGCTWRPGKDPIKVDCRTWLGHRTPAADVFNVMATTRGRHPARHRRHPLGLDPVHDLLNGLARQRRKHRSCGNGAHGPRGYDWARVKVRPWHREDHRHCVIARRSMSRPQERLVLHRLLPGGTTLDELIHVAGSRRSVYG